MSTCSPQKAYRETWPWLPGTIEQQCGPDEWLVTIEDRRLAELDDGSPAPEGTADDDLLFPQCFRESSEIRRFGAPRQDGGRAVSAASRPMTARERDRLLAIVSVLDIRAPQPQDDEHRQGFYDELSERGVRGCAGRWRVAAQSEARGACRSDHCRPAATSRRRRWGTEAKRPGDAAATGRALPSSTRCFRCSWLAGYLPTSARRAARTGQ